MGPSIQVLRTLGTSFVRPHFFWSASRHAAPVRNARLPSASGLKQDNYVVLGFSPSLRSIRTAHNGLALGKETVSDHQRKALGWSFGAPHSMTGAPKQDIPTPCASAVRRRKVRLTSFPPNGENFVRSLAPPFPAEPASLGFGGDSLETFCDPRRAPGSQTSLRQVCIVDPVESCDCQSSGERELGALRIGSPQRRTEWDAVLILCPEKTGILRGKIL